MTLPVKRASITTELEGAATMLFSMNCPEKSTLREKGGSNTGVIRRLPVKPSGSPKFVHRLFTTADAKIPLSVVQVKREPQHVVFCCACVAPSLATARFRCAKRKQARQSASSRTKSL